MQTGVVLWTMGGILLSFLLLPLSFCVGWAVLKYLLRALKVGDETLSEILLSPEGYLQSFCFGTILLLCIELLLLSFGLSWNATTALVLVAGGAAIGPSWGAFESAFRLAWRGASTINFALWILIIAILGPTLVGSLNGIVTPWVNNYGDLAWHLGIISSFAVGMNFPPEYQIFPGERLSYPFLVDFWTASTWWTASNTWALTFHFAFEWMVCWLLIYAALRGNRNWILPWTVLFGGGSSLLIFRLHPLLKTFQQSGGHAHSLLEQGFPWAPFLTTVWVTQRPALFGAAIFLCALGFFHRFLATYRFADPGEREDRLRAILFVLGIPLSLSVLVHTHLFGVVILYLAAWYFFGICLAAVKKGGWPSIQEQFYSGILFGLFLIPSLFFLPIIWGKRGIVSFTMSWNPWRWVEGKGVLSAVGNDFVLWLTNAEAWIICAGLLCLFLPRRRELASLFAIFVLMNFVRTSVWEWDQIKVFLGIYLAFMSVWAYAEKNFPESSPAVRKIQFAALLLIVPGLTEFSEAFFRLYQNYTVYSLVDLRLAETLRQITPRDAIIAAAPDHNSPVTLSGRKLFQGYNGTLSSHGLSYQSREEMTKSFTRLLHCVDEAERAVVAKDKCPQYLVWTERERRLWPGKDPKNFPELGKTAAIEIWRILPALPGATENIAPGPVSSVNDSLSQELSRSQAPNAQNPN